MRIAADHAGCELKERVKAHLLELRHQVKYTAEQRHQRRLAKVKAIERRFRGERQETMTSKLD